MAETLSAHEKLALIYENLQEVLKADIIEDVIIKQNRPLVIYWGMPQALHICRALIVIPAKHFPHRYCNDRKASLWLLCGHN